MIFIRDIKLWMYDKLPGITLARCFYKECFTQASRQSVDHFRLIYYSRQQSSKQRERNKCHKNYHIKIAWNFECHVTIFVDVTFYREGRMPWVRGWLTERFKLKDILEEQIVKIFIWTILSESQDFETTYSQQFPPSEIVNSSWRRLSSRNASIHLITHSYPYTQTSHSRTHIATSSTSFFTFTPTHGSCPQTVYVLYYPLMLNILFANPISLNTKVQRLQKYKTRKGNKPNLYF